MRLMLCLMSTLLAACATDGLVRGEPVPQQVVITAPCLTKAEVPTLPSTHARRGMDQKQKTAAALADLSDYEKYAVEADGKLRVCAGASDGAGKH